MIIKIHTTKHDFSNYYNDVEDVTIVALCEDQNPDGCNYTDVVPPSSSFPEILLKRGFVAVDATIRGKVYRFVNTHLEGAGPTDLNSERKIQSLLAEELVKTLHATTPDDLLITTSHLDERLDLIFIRNTSFLPIAFVTGRVPIFR
jgi:hypothetical protein